MQVKCRARPIDPKKPIIQKDACTPMFFEALFKIARTRKQLKCALTEAWIKKMWYLYTTDYCMHAC